MSAIGWYSSSAYSFKNQLDRPSGPSGATNFHRIALGWLLETPGCPLMVAGKDLVLGLMVEIDATVLIGPQLIPLAVDKFSKSGTFRAFSRFTF